MILPTFFVVLVSLHVVSASSLGFEALHRRQTAIPAPPPECAASCNALNFDTCATDPAPCCTTTTANNLKTCYICTENATGSTDFSTPQNLADELFVLCAALGHSIPKIDFPGQDPNRALPTSILPSGVTLPSTSTSITATVANPSKTQTSSSGPAISSNVGTGTISIRSQSTVSSLVPTTSTPLFTQSIVTSVPSNTPLPSPSTPAPNGASKTQAAILLPFVLFVLPYALL